MNRELAKDILIQSDRLVDLLLPIDSMTRQPSLGPGRPTSRAPPFLLQGAGVRESVESVQRSSKGEGRAEGMELTKVERPWERGGDDVDFQEVLVSVCVYVIAVCVLFLHEFAVVACIVAG